MSTIPSKDTARTVRGLHGRTTTAHRSRRTHGPRGGKEKQGLASREATAENRRRAAMRERSSRNAEHAVVCFDEKADDPLRGHVTDALSRRLAAREMVQKGSASLFPNRPLLGLSIKQTEKVSEKENAPSYRFASRRLGNANFSRTACGKL